MKFRKIKKIVAMLLSASLLLNSSFAYANDVEVTADTETETETESYADEYKPINFWVNNFTIQVGANAAILKWNIGADVESYVGTHSVDVDIYRSVGDASNYSRIASINSNCQKSMTYTDSTLLAGNKYYYKIRISGYFDEVGVRVYHELDGAFAEYAYNPVKLINPKTELQLNVNTLSNHRIRLSWYQIYAKGSTVTSYQVYKSSSRDTGYKLVSTIANVSGKAEYEYIDNNTVLGNTYYYKIRAVLNKGKSYSDYSNIVTGVATIDRPTILSAKSLAARTITITWKKIEDANGYYVYYKKGAKGTYTLATKSYDKNLVSFNASKLTNGKRYYFKVVAFMMNGGKEYVNEATKAKYCDYYGYKNESTKHKYRRIFKKAKYVYYKSDLIARRHMKTIKIRVWDKTSKRWYTRKFSLTVNRAIAPTVKAIFRELYKLKEEDRRPIHDIGGYSWRGKGSTSEHNQGLAIDINANENYMIRNGNVQAGSFWKPKKSLYSIPLKCKFVNVLRKYGFDRCIWEYSATEYVRDYMHFSYNGGR